MPRATELALRLALDRMVRAGASPSDIARRLGLPPSTVRGLVRRARQAGDTPAALLPRYHACGPRPPAPPSLEPALDLRRRHPRWGAGRIRVELAEASPATPPPSVRTLQRWLKRHGLAPAPAGRSRGTAWRRAEEPHDVWEVDAADQKRIADGRMVSWLRVVDECTGAALHTRVFPPRLLHPGAGRCGPGGAAQQLPALGPAAVGAGGQRLPVGFVG